MNGIKITRFKGLGEMDGRMWDTLDPVGRTLSRNR